MAWSGAQPRSLWSSARASATSVINAGTRVVPAATSSLAIFD